MQTLVMGVLCAIWLLYEATASKKGQVSHSGTTLNKHNSVSLCCSYRPALEPDLHLHTYVEPTSDSLTPAVATWPAPSYKHGKFHLQTTLFPYAVIHAGLHAYNLRLTKLCRLVEVSKHVCHKYLLMFSDFIHEDKQKKKKPGWRTS